MAHNVVDKNGSTALHLTAEKGLEGTCAAIAGSEHFTAHNVVDKHGKTALLWAAEKGHEGTCAAILASEHFTAHNVVDNKYGRTALLWAAEKGLEGTCVAIFASEHFDASDSVVSSALGAALASDVDNTPVLRAFILRGWVTAGARELLSDELSDVLDAITHDLYAPGGAGAAGAAANFERVAFTLPL